MEEDEPQSNMVPNEEKIPQFDGAEIPLSIQAKDLDRTNDEGSIAIDNLDEEKPQVTSSSTIFDGDESIEGKNSVLEEGLVESEGKRRDHKVDEIMGDNIEEKRSGFDGLLVNEQLTKQLSPLAEKEENFSSVEEALVEKDEKILPLVEGLGEGGGEVKAGVFHEVKHESFEEKFSDFDQSEHLKEEPPLLDEEEKVSSLEGGLGDNGGEVKAHVLDDVMQESVEEKLLDFDETHQNEHLKEELSLSDEKEKVFSLEEALVAKDENDSSLEEGLGEKGVKAHVFDEVKDDEASSYQGELDRKEKKASTLKQEGDEEEKLPLFEHSVSIGEKELRGDGTGSAEGGENVHPLQEALIEKDEKVSPCEEGLVEKEEAKDHVLYGTMQENVEWKPADSDEMSVEKVSPLQGDSVEKYKEESDEEDAVEMDTDEGGPASAAGRRTAMKQKSNHPRATQGRRIRARSKPKEDESLCFICFDGGDLVLCDHRSCPKVYHPSCVNRDEEYFKAKGQWICGWHICSNCQKSAHYMCYTCTYSMCRGCIKEAEFVCVRGSKGFCQDCMKTVLLIETNKHEDGTTDVVDFDDKTSWLSLFKDYWLELNAKLLLTMEDLTRARNPLKEANVISCDEEMSKMRVLQYKEPLENSGSAHDDQGASSSSRPRRHKESTSARRTWKKRSRNTSNKELREAQVGRTSISGDIEWASKELLEFVAHMKDGDTPVLSHFDVQALLLQYIKQNNLRDPLRKSQIICDARLMSLFGKARVGHLEILKLLDPHLLIKEASPLATDDNQGGVVDPDPSQMDAEGNSDASTKTTLDTRRKVRRKMEGGSTNLDEYAAIDVHNVSLLYLRRNLMECLLEDIDMFNENVVGAFVRIRISGSSSNKDLYRLVQIVGTGKAAGKYRTGKKTTDITLEILNLSKRDVITIDLISNQEFTEEECKRLRQSVKCGFIDRLTVAQVQEKARGLHTLRVNDWLESEKLRLGHLRDRASEKGRKKEHRECVEKLQLLSTPEEHLRRLNEVPDIHVDPKMALDYESTEDEDLNCERQAKNKMVKYSVRDRDEFSARRGGSATRKDSDVACNSNRSAPKAGLQDVVSPNAPPVRIDGSGNNVCQVSSLKSPKANVNANGTDDDILKNSQPVIEPAQFSCIPPQTTPQPQTTNDVSSNELSETDKMWHYQDPAGKIQGPFSMTQLRKWSSSGFFPTNLRIWRTSEKQEDSVLLTDAVSVKFHKDLHKQEPQHSNTNQPANVAAMADPRVDNVGDGLKANNTSQPTQPSSLSTTITGMVSPTDGRLAVSSIGCESSKDFNALSGQTQGYNCPRPITPFPRNSTQQPSFQGRGGRGESNGRWNGGQDRQHNWNYNRPRKFLPNGRGYERQHPYRSSSGQRFSGEQLKVQQPANIPAHAPQAGSMDWASLQGALNRIIPSPSPCNLPSTMNSVGGCVSNALTSVNPAKTQENIGVLNNLQPQNKPLESAAPVTPGDHLVYGGSNATQIVDGSNRKQLLEGNGSSIAPNTDQASTSVLNSEYMQPTNSHVNETGDHTVPSNKVDATMMPTEAQQEAQASADKRLPVGGMPLGSAVASNPIGSSNLPDASASTSKAQSESRCFSSVSVQEHGSNALNVNPAQPLSMVYPATPGTTNSGWGMVAHGPTNSNWGTPANMNMGWAQPAQAIMNLNLGWAIPTQGMPMHVSSAVNPGWVAPVIGNANPNPCWVAPPTVGNANQSAAWGSMMPGTGQASMNNTSNQNAGDGGSSHPQPGEQRLGVCKFHESGHCKKGASCNYIHL